MKSFYQCLLLLGMILTTSLQAQTKTQLLLTNGDYNGVVQQLEKDSMSLNDQQRYYLSTAFYQLGYHERAIHFLKQCNRETNADFNDLLCRCYYSTGDYSNAFGLCESRYQTAPNDVKNLLRYAEIGNFYTDYDLSIELLNTYVATDSTNYNVNLLLADTYQKAKVPDMAISMLKLILRQNPNNQKIAYRLGQLYYNQKNYVECHELCLPFIDKLEKNNRFLMLAAMANFKSGFNTNVLIFLKRMENKGDSSFLTKKYLGMASHRLSHTDYAVKYLEAAFKIKNDDPEVCFFLGTALGTTNQPLKGAPYLKMAESLIQPDASLMERINFKLAEMHNITGNYSKALVYYQTAFKYAPEQKRYIYWQATIYDHKIKDSKKAMEMYEKFIGELPDGPKKKYKGYTIYLKEIAEKRLTTLKEEDFFKNGIN